MTINLSVSIQAGHLSGQAFWDHDLQSFAAMLELFAEPGSFPPSHARIGQRPGELPTVDALAHHLQRHGLGVDAASSEQLQHLRRTVADRVGTAEVVGLVEGELRHLVLLTPSRLALRLQPAVAHPAYRFTWGEGGPDTVEAARAIGERVLGSSSDNDLATFALTLTVEYLASVDGDFSIEADSLCDWYLTDTPLSTDLDPLDLLALRRQLSSPHPALLASGGWGD
jgi:hypothetical protein